MAMRPALVFIIVLMVIVTPGDGQGSTRGEKKVGKVVGKMRNKTNKGKYEPDVFGGKDDWDAVVRSDRAINYTR